MNTIIRLGIIPILALAALLAGCAGTPTQDLAALNKPLAAKSARLKIVREGEFAAIAADARLMLDGKEIGKVSDGDIRVFDVAAGKHQITVDHWQHPNVYKFDLDAKPGIMYTLEISAREEAAVAGAVLGLVGMMLEAAANENGGTFKIQVIEEKSIST